MALEKATRCLEVDLTIHGLYKGITGLGIEQHDILVSLHSAIVGYVWRQGHILVESLCSKHHNLLVHGLLGTLQEKSFLLEFVPGENLLRLSDTKVEKEDNNNNKWNGIHRYTFCSVHLTGKNILKSGFSNTIYTTI